MKWRGGILLAVLLAVVASQRTFTVLRGNERLVQSGFKPRRYELWSRVFRNVRPGATVTIPAGRAIRVDVRSIPRLSGLRVDGLLYFPENSNVNLVVRTGYVLVRGFLRVGSLSRGMLGRSAVTFELLNGRSLIVPTGGLRPLSNQGPAVRNIIFGTRAFAVAGGRVELAGLGNQCSQQMGTVLERSVSRGAIRIRVNTRTARCWRPGMEIGIAPSTTNFKEAERRIIRRIRGQEITLDRPLQHLHLGKNHRKVVGGKLVELAAEVILLSRSIKITSDSSNDEQGAHFMIAHTGSQQVVQGVEFRRTGQRGTLGRYPLHAHFCGDGRHFSFTGNAVVDSHQRGIVLHATNNVRVQYNVLYNTMGHGIMVAEDHLAMRNVVMFNTIVLVRRFRKGRSLPGRSDERATGIWIGNPQNRMVSNRVGGSEQSGIWFDLTTTVIGSARALPAARGMSPRTLPLLELRANLVHSCSDHGIRFYPGRWIPAPGTGNVAVGNTAYRNTGFGFFVHAHFSTKITDSIFYDNVLGGVDFDRSLNMTLQNSVIIGHTGRPGAVCPKRTGMEFPPSRFPHHGEGNYIQGVTFDGFRVCPSQPIGIDPNDRNSAAGWVATSTTIRDCKFLDGSVPMHMSYATSGRNNLWDKDIAVRMQNTAGIRDGFFISNGNRFLRPRRGYCATMWGGLGCQNVCLRTVSLNFSRLRSSIKNLLVQFRRVSDGAVKTSPVIYNSRFYFTVEGNQAYEVRLIPLRGSRLPSYMEIDMADNLLACNAGVELRFVQRGYNMRMLRYGAIAEPVRDCGRRRNHRRPTYYGRCNRGVSENVVNIQGGPWRGSRPRGIRAILNNGSGRCARNSCK